MLNQRIVPVLVGLVSLLGLAACDDSKSSDHQGDHDHAQQAQEHHDHEGEGHDHAHEGGEHHGDKADESADDSASVSVPKDGKKFDPAVSVDKLPKGAWHCDMGGKSHYAAMQKGDGRCPVCNMMLKQAE